MTINNRRWIFLGIVVLGLVLRYVFIFYLTAQNSTRSPMDDDGDHIRFAQTWFHHGVYASSNNKDEFIYRAWRPPLFISALTGVFKLYGYEAFLPARLYIATFSMLIPLFMWKLAKKIWDSNVGLVAFAWGAIHPAFIYYAGVIQDSSTFLIFSTMATVQLIMNQTVFQAVITGILMGISCLGRSQFIGMAGMGFLWMVFFSPGDRRKLRAAVYMAALILTMLPWWIRNYRVFHRFVPVSTEGGYTLWLSNHPLTDGGGNCIPSTVPQNLNEIERDRWHYRETLKEISDNPKRTFTLARTKIARYWGIVPRVGGKPLKLFFFAIYFPMFLMTLVGLWSSRQKIILLLPILGMAAYYSTCHMIFVSVIRYRLPLEPFLICLASAGVVMIYKKLKQGTS